MKKSRAIELLKLAVPIKALTQQEYSDFIEAVNMGMDALKKQLLQKGATKGATSDLINKQDALDIFDDYNISVESGELEAYSRDRKRLYELPTIQPVATDICVGNNSEIPNSSDTISRQAAIDALMAAIDDVGILDGADIKVVFDNLPPAQPEQSACEYCHEDSNGYVKPLEKNCHASIRFGMDGWELSLHAKGWHGSAKIKYCPICGRRLTYE